MMASLDSMSSCHTQANSGQVAFFLGSDTFCGFCSWAFAGLFSGIRSMMANISGQFDEIYNRLRWSSGIPRGIILIGLFELGRPTDYW